MPPASVATASVAVVIALVRVAPEASQAIDVQATERQDNVNPPHTPAQPIAELLNKNSELSVPRTATQAGLLNASHPDRVYSRRTPAELVDEVQGKTSLVQSEVSRRHVGQWLTVSGKVFNVTAGYLDLMITLQRTGEEPIILLRFDPDLWKPHLSTLDMGDSVIAIGNIDTITDSMLVLANCELVD